jgi:hypothetical protein
MSHCFLRKFCEFCFSTSKISSRSLILSIWATAYYHRYCTLFLPFQVNTNGVISFLQRVSTYTPTPFPIENNARIIAPFWADVDTNRGGTVWYRETTNNTLLDKASEEIRAYFPQFYRFKPSWIFVATWDRVAFYGCSSCSKVHNGKTS